MSIAEGKEVYSSGPAGTVLTTREQPGDHFLPLGKGGGLITHHLREERPNTKMLWKRMGSCEIYCTILESSIVFSFQIVSLRFRGILDGIFMRLKI